jgi:cytochrome c553
MISGHAFPGTTQLILGLIAGLLLSSATWANEPPVASSTQSVEEKAAPCAACHGPKGVSENPLYPSLAGQYRDYLEMSLSAYKSSARKNPVMAGMAAPLSDQDIMALAAYFAAQKGPLYTPALK